MRRIKLLCALVLTGGALALAAGAATPALAAGNPVIQDCYTHGKLTRSYTEQQLTYALHHLSAYIKQYTACQNVIQDAVLHSGKVKSNGTGGGGGSSISTGLIIVIVVVVLAILAFGLALLRRRRTLGDRGGDAP
jgi:hypothetical protein